MTEPDPNGDQKDPLIEGIRLRSEREQRWLREGDPSISQRLAQIGVLGWMIVAPTLIGLFAGRWLDQKADSGIFWSAPMMMLGLIMGCWSAWKWIKSR